MSPPPMRRCPPPGPLASALSRALPLTAALALSAWSLPARLTAARAGAARPPAGHHRQGLRRDLLQDGVRADDDRERLVALELLDGELVLRRVNGGDGPDRDAERAGHDLFGVEARAVLA